MQKKLTSLIVLALFSLLLFTLPALADSKQVPSSNMSDMSMSNMDMSGNPSSDAALNTAPSSEVTATKGDNFQVSVQTDPENPSPNKPVNIMITVKNKATGQPVLDAAVKVDMMLMDGGNSSSMPGMSMSSDTSIQGQAKPDDMEPGMYSVTLTPNQQGEWQQDVHISSPTLGETTTSVPLKVSKSGPNWILIGSVAGAIVLAGILAQVLKRKPNAAKEV